MFAWQLRSSLGSPKRGPVCLSGCIYLLTDTAKVNQNSDATVSTSNTSKDGQEQVRNTSGAEGNPTSVGAGCRVPRSRRPVTTTDVTALVVKTVEDTGSSSYAVMTGVQSNSNIS